MNCQIISPHDSGIAAAIRSNLTPGLTSGWGDVARDASKHLNALNITQEIYEEYISLLKGIIKPMYVLTITKPHNINLGIYLGHPPVLSSLSQLLCTVLDRSPLCEPYMRLESILTVSSA